MGTNSGTGNRWFSIHTVAVLAGVTERTVRRDIAAGSLKSFVRQGQRWIRAIDAAHYRAGGAAQSSGLNHDNGSHFWRFVSVRVFAAINRQTVREVYHQIEKGAIDVVRIGPGRRMFVAGDEVYKVLQMSDKKKPGSSP